MRTPKELGAAIAALRHEKGLTQKMLAERLNITDKAISRWERGLGYPDIQLLEDLCTILETPLEELLKNEDREQLPLSSVSNETEKGTDPGADLPSQEDAGARLRAIHEAYAGQRVAYRKKAARNKRIMLVSAALLLIALLMILIPLKTRIRGPLYGEYTSEQGDVISVTIELNGFRQHYLLRSTDRFKGDLAIRRADDGETLYAVHAVGKRTATGDEMIGVLMKAEDTWYFTGSRFSPRSTKVVSLNILFSEDFSKLWIIKNEEMPGHVLAASDPDMDLQKVRERFLSRWHIQWDLP